MQMQMSNGQIVQPFTTKLPPETIDLLKSSAVAEKKAVYKLLNELIINGLSESKPDKGKHNSVVAQ